MRIVFLAAICAQLILGLWRARLLGSSVTPALALAALIAVVGGLWFMKRYDAPGAPLANLVALLAATVGALSAISAANAPFIGSVARISVPLFAFAIAALLAVARQERRFVWPAAIALLIALAILEIDLTRDASWEAARADLR
ncbi:MAG TPA: hypothetical protein VM779_03730 [Thermoanaerobaculia bacterium]|nr:hypothetical protein [Thermoanaerobaculia bacterium]